MSTVSSSKSFFSFLAVAAVVTAGAATVHAGDFSAAGIVRPKAGLSLDIGSKKAVGYFLAQRGGCDLTLLVGEAGEVAAETQKASVPARFSTLVAAGRTAHIDTGEGPSVELFCSTGASFLTTRVIDRVAYSARPQF